MPVIIVLCEDAGDGLNAVASKRLIKLQQHV